MIALDTNVLVRILLDDDPQQHAAARRLLDSLSIERPGYVSSVVLVETYWVLVRTRGIDASTVLAAFRRMQATPEFRGPARLVDALDAADSGADFADALIDASARSAGVRTIATFDKRAARRLGWTLLGRDPLP